MFNGKDPESKLVVLWDGRNWSSEHAPERLAQLRDKLEFFIRKCGADPQRCLEGPFPSLDTFARRHRRILDPDKMRAGQVVVIFTKTLVLTDIVQTRQQLGIRIPVLEDALWIIYDDLSADSRFTKEMEVHGSLDDHISRGPIWTATFIDKKFLVLTPDIGDLEHFQAKLKKACVGGRSSSGRSPSVSGMPAVRPPSSGPIRPPSLNDLPTVRPPPGATPPHGNLAVKEESLDTSAIPPPLKSGLRFGKPH